MSVLFPTALILALLVALTTRYTRFFPFWGFWLALTAYQSVAVFIADEWSQHWWEAWWAPVEAAAMLCGVLAIVEALWLRTAQLHALDRFWLRFGLAVMPFSVVFYVATIPYGTRYAEFLAWREWYWMWLALTCCTGWLFFGFRAARCPLLVRRHAALLGVLVIAHALAAPQLHVDRIWFDVRFAYRIVAVICCIGWISNALATRRSIFLTYGIAHPFRPLRHAEDPTIVVPIAQSPLHSADCIPLPDSADLR